MLYDAGVKGITDPNAPIPASAKDVLEQIRASAEVSCRARWYTAGRYMAQRRAMAKPSRCIESTVPTTAHRTTRLTALLPHAGNSCR
jgi:hypothetical protein